MTVMLTLSCNGACGAEVEVGPLRRRHESLFGGPLCVVVTDELESLTPEGWVMFDPYTFMTYCPSCWAGITAEIDADRVAVPAETTEEKTDG